MRLGGSLSGELGARFGQETEALNAELCVTRGPQSRSF